MKYLLSVFILSVITSLTAFCDGLPGNPVRILVITGGHSYKTGEFNNMLQALGPGITYQVAELPDAFRMFLPDNRNKYDVLVFYHMWQKITEEQARSVSECIWKGKPLVVLHHSICAFDDWPEYWDIIGGKYFHKETSFRGKTWQPCSYIHDLNFKVQVVNRNHPVTNGISDFRICDETYKGYYVADNVTPLLTTDEPSSNKVIGWAKRYGKARIVVFQSGHDAPTFENPDYRKLLKQSVEWVYSGKN
jgi:type 1 glutamine amidotransferase